MKLSRTETLIITEKRLNQIRVELLRDLKSDDVIVLEVARHIETAAAACRLGGLSTAGTDRISEAIGVLKDLKSKRRSAD